MQIFAKKNCSLLHFLVQTPRLCLHKDGCGGTKKVSVAYFSYNGVPDASCKVVVGRAEARIALMSAMLSPCDRFAERENVLHCLAVISEMEKPIDFWLRKEGAAGSVAPT